MSMKKEIRLMLDYQSYPIWIYDENGNFIDNEMVKEIEEDEMITSMLEDLQDKFDSLYLNSKMEFKYIGFTSDKDRKAFEEKVNQVYKKLCDLLDEKYHIKNMIDITNL